MEPATEISEFGTGLRAHLGLDHRSEELAEEAVPEPAYVEPELDDLGVLALLEAELIDRERALSAREAMLEARGAHTGVDELALARERRARLDA